MASKHWSVCACATEWGQLLAVASLPATRAVGASGTHAALIYFNERPTNEQYLLKVLAQDAACIAATAP